ATAATPGGVAGYEQDTKIQQGELGTPILQSSQQYVAFAAGGQTDYLIASSTVYRNTDGTGAETTTNSYTMFPGTLQIQSQTVARPVISAVENGPGTADVETTVNDIYGREIWHKDAGGFINYTVYDL